MRQKMMWRYYCDHCKKSSCSKSAMEKHERRCTSNPNRECGLCIMRNGGSGYIKECLDVLKPYIGLDEHTELPKDIVGELDRAADDCHACVYAALKQSRLLTNFPNARCDHHGAINAEFKQLMDDLHDEYQSIVGYVG